MRIAIIGCGWLGAHLAFKLRDVAQICIYEHEGIFSKSSFRNQNRLHLGYHYARSYLTRHLCSTTFDRFLADYQHLTSEIIDNIYAVPKWNSMLDFATYLTIFPHEKPIDLNYLEGIEGAISTKERYIDPIKSKIFFERVLSQYVVDNQGVDLKGIAQKYDLVFNCTNNQIHPISEPQTYEENCRVLIYTRKKVAPFGALTLVDGEFFSIFPFVDDSVTLTDVEYTPRSDLTEREMRTKTEEKVRHYFPSFDEHFTFSHSFQSLKVKIKSKSASRAPIIVKENNIISCFTGKIQGIYFLEDYARGLLCEF